jgi:hypothetical protein
MYVYQQPSLKVPYQPPPHTPHLHAATARNPTSGSHNGADNQCGLPMHNTSRDTTYPIRMYNGKAFHKATYIHHMHACANSLGSHQADNVAAGAAATVCTV